MKVLYLTNIPSPYRIDFFNELSKYCELTVAFERKTASNRNNEWLNNRNFDFEAIFLKGINFGVEGAFCPDVINIIKKQKFDVIIVGGYSTPTGMLIISYLKIMKIPFILNCDGAFIKKDNKLKYSFKRFFISSATAYIATSNNSVKYLKYYGAGDSKIFLYPFSSISEKDILKEMIGREVKKKLKKELNISEKNVVLSVGQFIKRKGFDILIESANSLLPDTGVYIIGDKPKEEYIELINRFNLKNVHFINFKPKEELRKYYMIADVFAFPTREDIWGLVINEAISFGLPVISTDNCNAALELIKDGENGYIIPTEDSDVLSKKINKILRESTLKQNMIDNNLKIAEDYTIERMANKHIEILNKFVSKE